MTDEQFWNVLAELTETLGRAGFGGIATGPRNSSQQATLQVSGSDLRRLLGIVRLGLGREAELVACGWMPAAWHVR